MKTIDEKEKKLQEVLNELKNLEIGKPKQLAELEILEKQKESLENALKNTREQITVAYSTYDTAASAANLVNLISQTQNTFNEIMNLQLPEIVPFENAELAMRFEEISNRMIESYEDD